jgi:hypothetical protein
MLNFELARIVIEERRRKTSENLRQAGFRVALAERIASRRAGDDAPGAGDPACTESGQRAKPALG